MNNIKFLVEEFCKGRYNFEVPDNNWLPVFEYLAENQTNLNFCKNEIHMLWTVNGGHLRRKIQDDQLIAKVLRATMPSYIGEGLELYRGECRFLFESGNIGFCWTPKIEVATRFASGLNALESGGVLLKAYAPPTAIFSSPNTHSSQQMQEFEYTCDPHLLENIQVINTYEKPRNN